MTYKTRFFLCLLFIARCSFLHAQSLPSAATLPLLEDGADLAGRSKLTPDYGDAVNRQVLGAARESYKGQWPGYGSRFHRKRIVHIALTAVFIAAIASALSFLVFNRRNLGGNGGEEIRALWEQGDYERTFALSREGLEGNPLDGFLLVMHGFSSYQLGVALLQNIYDTRFEGYDEVQRMYGAWLPLRGRVDGKIFDTVKDRLERQLENARQWRDVVNTYFFRKTGIGDKQGRTIY